MPPINNDWLEPLKPEFGKPYYKKLYQKINEEYQSRLIFPPADDIFNAFAFTPLKDVKVVILGQDPYHGPGQANGMCFSVAPGVPMPPSLLNIFKEVSADTGAPMPPDGDLSRWARQGVFLLNATLTVDAHHAASHQGMGWERFTDAVICKVSQQCDHVVFMLWGSYAIRKQELIDKSRHLVLTSPHPSPLSAYRGFFGNHHFTTCNSWLQQHGKEPVAW